MTHVVQYNLFFKFNSRGLTIIRKTPCSRWLFPNTPLLKLLNNYVQLTGPRKPFFYLLWFLVSLLCRWTAPFPTLILRHHPRLLSLPVVWCSTRLCPWPSPMFPLGNVIQKLNKVSLLCWWDPIVFIHEARWKQSADTHPVLLILSPGWPRTFFY